LFSKKYISTYLYLATRRSDPVGGSRDGSFPLLPA
jgi:hypothetical protein